MALGAGNVILVGVHGLQLDCISACFRGFANHAGADFGVAFVIDADFGDNQDGLASPDAALAEGQRLGALCVIDWAVWLASCRWPRRSIEREGVGCPTFEGLEHRGKQKVPPDRVGIERFRGVA